MQSDISDIPDVIMLFAPPIPSKNCKNAWNVFTAACEFIDTLRHSGHAGIAISIYFFEGCLLTALSRHLHARHEMYYDSGDSGVAQTAELTLLQLTDWVVPVKCCLHSCSNGVSWA